MSRFSIFAQAHSLVVFCSPALALRCPLAPGSSRRALQVIL